MSRNDPSLDDRIAGLTCRQVLDVLSDYVDGELASEVRHQVEAHVGECSNCERFGGMFGRVVREIRAAVDASDDRAAFEKLRARLDGAS